MTDPYADIEACLWELKNLATDPLMPIEIFIPDPINAGSSISHDEREELRAQIYEGKLVKGVMSARVSLLLLMKVKLHLLILDLDRMHNELDSVRDQILLPIRLRRNFIDRDLVRSRLDSYFVRKILTSDMLDRIIEIGPSKLAGTRSWKSQEYAEADEAIKNRDYGRLARLFATSV